MDFADLFCSIVLASALITVTFLFYVIQGILKLFDLRVSAIDAKATLFCSFAKYP